MTNYYRDLRLLTSLCSIWSAATFLPATARTADKHSERIVDGKDVQPINKYPMMLAIGMVTPSCGGTILNSEWGLSAAHCLIPATPRADSSYFALAGLYYFEQPDPEWTQNVTITEIIIHHDHDAVGKGKFANDIAVFRVSPPFIFNERVAPTNLPSCDWDLQWHDKEQNGTAIGWGQMRMTDGMREKRAVNRTGWALQEVEIPLRSTHACRRAKFGDQITDDHLCAGGENGEGACYGDSGGPLFIYSEPEDAYIQVGLTSFGSPNCGTPSFDNTPVVFTKVSKYLHWIDETIRVCPTPRSVPDPNGR